MRSALKLLWPFTRGRRGAFAAGLAGTLLVTAAELARPFPLKLILDRLLAPGPAGPEVDLAFVAAVAALVVGTAAVGAAGTYLTETQMRIVGEHVVHDLRVALYSHLHGLSLRFHRRRHTGDLVTRVTGDVHTMGELVGESLIKVLAAVLLLAGMLVVSIRLDPVLALAALLVTPLLALATVQSQRRIKTAARSQRAAEGAIAALGTDSLSAIGTVKALGGEHSEQQRLQSQSIERRDAGVSGSIAEGRFGGVVDLLEAVGTALVLGLGAFRVVGGHLTPGDLVVMHSYLRRLYRPLRDLTRQAGRIARATARSERIREVLGSDDTLPEKPNAYSGPRAEGNIRLRDVYFAYEAGRPALKAVSFSVQAGESVAIVGTSGAGKSTLAALMGRFHDPDAGAVLLDGRDLRDCSLAWLRNQVGFVLQDTALFSGTVADNIAYSTDATRRMVIQAARRAGAHEFITALPDGYDTDLGPSGASLSGGQRQRLAIARVLLRNPPVVVLDEPTSGLDAATELDVMAALRQALKGRTTVLITHSLRLARTAEQVFVIDAGRVVEQGAPEQLIAGRGRFRSLAAAQGLAGSPRLPAPDDHALPQMSGLLDPDAVESVLTRTSPDPQISGLAVRYIRYKPQTNVVVDYDVAGPSGRRRVVLMAAAGRSMAKLAHRTVAPTVAGNLAYDEQLNLLVQWLPLDLWLPSLSEPVETLTGSACIPYTAGDEVELLAYKPRRRAVVGVDGHVLKLYADEDAFRAAAAALLGGHRLPVATAVPTGVVSKFLMTAQESIKGSPIQDPIETAPEAGDLLTRFHRGTMPALNRTLDPFESARGSARTASHLVPALRGRLEHLVERLAASAPPPGSALCHGDFHSRQLLETPKGLVVLDLDEAGLGSPAIDLATYAAHVLRGGGEGVDGVDEVLSALAEGYGRRPDGLDWHAAVAVLRLTVFPFRTYPTVDWPDQVEVLVGVAEGLAAR